MPLTELILTPLIIGLGHSVETDHVIAVGNLVGLRSRSIDQAIHGATWGFGHTISVMLSALTFSYMKDFISFPFHLSFELFVGIMMVIIGAIRIFSITRSSERKEITNRKFLFFNVGIVHGFAGSGAIAAMLSTQTSGMNEQLLFLMLFGAGTILGMGAITAILTRLKFLSQSYLAVFSYVIAFFSILYGVKIIIEQI